MTSHLNPDIDSALLSAKQDLNNMELMLNHLVSRPPVQRAMENVPDWVDGCLLIDSDDIEALARMFYLLRDDVGEIRQAHQIEEAARV